jgi:molecular chaperone GrpE
MAVKGQLTASCPFTHHLIRRTCLAKEIEIIVEEENEDLKTPRSETEPQRHDSDNYLEQLQRLQAEFENYRKRTLREREQLADEVRADFCTQLLPILDDLERALSQDEGSPDSLRSGLQLINKNFKSVLEKMGLKSIPALGQPFDPHVHEAVMVEADPTAESETITGQLLPGYLFKDRLIRPAKVKVSKAFVSKTSVSQAQDDITDSQETQNREGTDSTHGQQRPL